ncbi:MAG TPA: HEAT repeat domain-containing protein [Planctomycetota bacterium]
MKTTLRAGAVLIALSCSGLAVAQESNEVAVHISTAKLKETRGELAGAEQELRLALDKATPAERSAVVNALATLLVRQGRHNDARALTGAQSPQQGSGEDPIQRLITILDSAGGTNETVKDAARQLDTLGTLAVPHLVAALPKLGPFGTLNVLDRLVRYNDPRITTALTSLLDTADPAVVVTIATRVKDMPRAVAVPLAQHIAQAKVEPKVQINALAVLLRYEAAAASTRELAQRLAADTSGESQARLIPTLRGSQEAWVADVFTALMQHASADVRADATLQWILTKKDLTEQQALTAIEALPPEHRLRMIGELRGLHADWVKVGLLMLRTVRQEGTAMDPQALVEEWQWWRMPDESAPEILALGFAPEYAVQGARVVLGAVEKLVARGWALPQSLDARVAQLAAIYSDGWSMLANAVPPDAEDRALTVWQTATDRYSFVRSAVRAERPWHRVVARQLLQTPRSDHVEASFLQRDWTGAPAEAVAALAELAQRWPQNPAGGRLQWHDALVGAFRRHENLPPLVILPLVAAGDTSAWQALVARDANAALEQARGAARLHQHQVSDLASLLSRHGRPTDVPLALRVFELAESLNWGDYSQFVAFFAEQGAGNLDVIRLGRWPIPFGPGQTARMEIAEQAVAGARVHDLGELLQLAPFLDCYTDLMKALAPQIRAEHSATLIAAIDALLARSAAPVKLGDSIPRGIADSIILPHLCTLAGNTSDPAVLPVLQKVLELPGTESGICTTAATAALGVAGASRQKLVLEMLASPKPEVVRVALATAGPRLDAALRDAMRDAVLRLGAALDQVEPFFAKLDLEDRVALGLAVLESERFAKFTPDLSTAALKAVGLRKDVRYLPQLVKGSAHPHPQVRIQAASAIGNTFAREAGAPLIEMLRDDDPNVRSAAQNALTEIANYLDARAQWEQRFK